MKIYILKKSLSDLKNPIVKSEYVTDAYTVRDFICEMTEKNYLSLERGIGMSLDECKRFACDEFEDGSYYIVNTTKDIKYAALDRALDATDGDELVLIKLKYLRGIIW